MSRQYKTLAIYTLVASLVTLTGCIVTPDGNHNYNANNGTYNHAQPVNNAHQAKSNSAEWDRGCADAKAGGYDRSGNAGSGYEEGWQSCNNHAKQQSGNHNDKERERGCADAKAGSYDRSGNAGPTYEEGWQSCNKNAQQSETKHGGGVESAKKICMEQFGGSGHIQTISALKPGFWEIIMMDSAGRKVACTADTAAGNVADWVEM